MSKPRHIHHALAAGTHENAAGTTTLEPLRYGPSLVDELIDSNRLRDQRAMAVPKRKFRASWSGGCWRQLAYRMADTEPTEPYDEAGLFRMHTGTMIHDALEAAAPDTFFANDVEVITEKPVDLEPIGINGSATGDITVVYNNDAGDTTYTVVIEVKTINGFGFKMLDSEGPRYGHITQGALSAEAWNADELVILYVSMENISKGQAAKKGLDTYQTFLREFSFTPETWAPFYEAEKFRVAKVLEYLADGHAPGEVPTLIHDADRGVIMPRGTKITSQTTGTWATVDGDGTISRSGKTWVCQYCPFRTTCIDEGERP